MLTDIEDAFIGEEAELPKKVSCDLRPSKEEVALHNTSHLPYRSWCPHCVRGKARRRNHRKKVKGEKWRSSSNIHGLYVVKGKENGP